MTVSDRVLLEARDNSIQLEQMAVNDLAANLDSYLEPNWRARRMVDGYRYYVANQNNDHAAYLNMRKAFSETEGRCNRVFGDVLSSHIKPQRIDYSSTMFGAHKDWDAFVRGAASFLSQNGYWTAPFMAPPRLVQALKTKIENGMEKQHGDEAVKAFSSAPGAPAQLKSSSMWLSTVDEMFELAADPVLLGIVQAYLGVPPIFNTPVVLLNSASGLKGARDLSDVAQLYHHDLHRIRFVKVFIYLTDVDDSCGPHAMLKKTHLVRPKGLWEDGRHTDEAIERAGIADDEVLIKGKAGTVFLVDTSALHKGVHPESQSRVMAQVQYVNTVFGRPISSHDRKITAAPTTKDKTMLAAAEVVRKYADSTGVRFVQNFI